MNTNFSEIKEYFVILDITNGVHSFITVSAERTDRLYLTESFSSLKEVKKAIRAYSKFGNEKYAVAKITEAHSYKVGLVEANGKSHGLDRLTVAGVVAEKLKPKH